MAAEELRLAASELGRITSAVIEDVLDKLFADFLHWQVSRTSIAQIYYCYGLWLTRKLAKKAMPIELFSRY
jgi:hypothetical protein